MSETKQKKVKKPKSKARVIFEWVFTGIFALLFVFLGIAQIDALVHQNEHYGEQIRFGTGSFIVLTNSMEPVYNKDDAIITVAESMDSIVEKFNRGEEVDITFVNKAIEHKRKDIPFTHDEYKGNDPVVTNAVMTHRVMEVHIFPETEYGHGRYVFVTSGINHEGSYSKQGQYQLVDEDVYLGTVVHSSVALGHFFGFVSSPWGLLVLLLVPAGYLVVSSSIDILKTLKESEEKQESMPSGVDINKLSKEDEERLTKQVVEEMLKKAQLEQTKKEVKDEKNKKA